MKLRPMVALLFLIAAMPVDGQETPAELAKKLGSSTYLERERAAKMLEQLGKPAIPALRGVMANADLETQRRAVLLIERIEDQVLRDDLVQATPIRLQLPSISIVDAFGTIEAQMGLLLGAAATKQRLDKIDTGLIPYWQAWARIRDAARLHESDYALSAAKLKRIDEIEQEPIPILDGRDAGKGPRFTSPRLELAAAARHAWAEDNRHSVRVRVRWLITDRALDAKTPHAVFAFEVRPEPRLEIVSPPRVEITKLVDAGGQELPVRTAALFFGRPAPENVPYLLAYAGEIQFGGLLHLKAIPWAKAERSLKEMHGQVHVEAVVRASLVEVPGVLKAAGTEVRGMHGIKVRVLETDTSDEGDLVVRVRLSGLDSLTPHTPEQQIVRVRPGLVTVRGAIDVALERLVLVDQRGASYRQIKATYEQAEGEKGYDVELHYAAKARGKDEPTLLLTKAPRTVRVEVPFVVRDLVWTEEP